MEVADYATSPSESDTASTSQGQQECRAHMQRALLHCTSLYECTKSTREGSLCPTHSEPHGLDAPEEQEAPLQRNGTVRLVKN